MAFLTQAFIEFTTALTPTAAELEGVARCQDRAADAARAAWDATGAVLMGPVARGTAVSPIRAVPLVIELPERWYHRHAHRVVPDRISLLLADLEEALGPQLEGAPLLRGADALYVDMGGTEVALVPGFAADDGGHLLPDALLGEWRGCQLARQVSVIAERDAALAHTGRPLLRLMHGWAAQHQLSIHPLHLEIMSLSCMNHPPVHLADGVLTILQKMPQAVHDPCPDPGNSSHLLDTYLKGAAERQRVADAAFLGARAMTCAVDAARHGDPWAATLAREVFGSRFPYRKPPRPPSSSS